MYGDDAADEELRVAATAMVATKTTTWLLLDGDEMEVEDDDDEEEAEAAAEAQRDVELRAAAERAKEAAEAERVKAAAEAERAAATEAAEQAAHWAAEMDKALAYRRDVDRRTRAPIGSVRALFVGPFYDGRINL
jgi:biotin carboxyl carrier protein